MFGHVCYLITDVMPVNEQRMIDNSNFFLLLYNMVIDRLLQNIYKSINLRIQARVLLYYLDISDKYEIRLDSQETILSSKYAKLQDQLRQLQHKPALFSVTI